MKQKLLKLLLLLGLVIVLGLIVLEKENEVYEFEEPVIEETIIPFVTPDKASSENTILSVSKPTYFESGLFPVYGMKVAETSDLSDKSVTIRRMRVTAYAPLDPRAVAGMCHNGDPTSTASGKYPQYGMVATNAFPFGTQIRIPELFGNEIFVVEDRMSSRYQNTIDILVDNKDYALAIGSSWADIEILN